MGERLQVKLHDTGVVLSIRRLPRGELRAALAGGEYDLALVSFAALPEPGMAFVQLVMQALGREAARDELRRVGRGPTHAARRALAASRAQELAERLPLVPLDAQAKRLVGGRASHGWGSTARARRRSRTRGSTRRVHRRRGGEVVRRPGGAAAVAGLFSVAGGARGSTATAPGDSFKRHASGSNTFTMTGRP